VKNIERTAKVKYKDEDQYHTIEGVIKDVDENTISIELDESDIKKIPFDNVVETKIVAKI
jgi:ribosome maturation factor RimP